MAFCGPLVFHVPPRSSAARVVVPDWKESLSPAAAGAHWINGLAELSVKLPVLVALPEEPILNKLVLASLKILNAVPVKPLTLGTTNFMKSPLVIVEEEAVSQLPVVTVEEAFMEPPLAVLMLNFDTPEPFWISKAVVDEIFMSRPPAAVKPERKGPEELKLLIRFPVCDPPAVISIPELVDPRVVSTVKTLFPDPS